MDIRILNYFLMVAREENISKAASLLHITQPTLSRQLMGLEEELGVKLFNRSNHSIMLTEEGRLFKRRAQEIVELAEKTKRELKQEEELSGEISIGSGEYKSSAMLAEIIEEFQKDHPKVQFQIFSGNSDDIQERIEGGLLDIGFLLEPVDVAKYEFVRTPVKEEWGVIVSDKSDLAKRDVVKAQDIAGCPLIMGRRDMIKKEILNWFGSYADKLNIAAGGNLPYNLAALSRQQIGVFVNLKLNCSYEGVKYIPLYPKLESHTVLAWKKNQAMPAAARAFIEAAREYINRITEDEI